MTEVGETGGDVAGGRADRGDVPAALHLLERLDLTPEDLVEGVAARVVPTFEELVPRVVGAIPVGSRSGYRSYLNKLVVFSGSCRLDEFGAEEVDRFLVHVRETSEVRSSSTGGGIAASRNAHRALSWLYGHAVDRGLIGARQNVMSRVPRPRAGEPKRHGLSPELVAAILGVARTTGHDPALDALLLRFHLETAARTGGALALRLCDLDPGQSLVRLKEKGGRLRWHPVSPTLMEHLLDHARERGARDENDRVLRKRNGTALRWTHYQNLWARVGKYVETVRVRGISTHWLRHTTLTWVERNFGYAVARAYAGHTVPSSPGFGVTQVYVKAGIEEIASALQALTGERHPLALVPVSTGVEVDRLPVLDESEGAPAPAVEDVVVGRIRRMLSEAASAGQRRPSQDALMRATGASKVRVAAALAGIRGDGPGQEQVERVRRLLGEAGRRRPGAGALAAVLGVSTYRVAVALAEIRGVGDRSAVGDREELVEGVLRLREEAGRSGRGRRPGVVSLARALGVPRSRMEMVLAEVRAMTEDPVPGAGVGASGERAELVGKVRAGCWRRRAGMVGGVRVSSCWRGRSGCRDGGSRWRWRRTAGLLGGRSCRRGRA